MLFLDIPRVGIWVLLIVLAVLGQAPWWLPVVAVLYDMRWVTYFTLPWKRKAIQAQIEAQRQSYIDAVMGRLPPSDRKDN